MSNSTQMPENYNQSNLVEEVCLRTILKIALRNIKKQKMYSFINIAILDMGMACAILIILWVLDELSYDTFYDHSDRIYRAAPVIFKEDGKTIHSVSNCFAYCMFSGSKSSNCKSIWSVEI